MSNYIITFLFTAILLTSSSTQCQEISKIDFLIGQILEPYTNHLTTFKENVHTSLQNPLVSLLIDSVPQEIFQDTLDYCAPSIPKKSLNVSKPTIYTPPRTSHNNTGRMLQPSITCFAGGYGVEVNVNVYICNGNKVSKSFYEAIRGVGCSKSTYQTEMCYCPFDYYGEECENFNRPNCDVQRISHPLTQCSKQDSRNYVYTHGQNDMPCHYVDRNKPLDLEFRLSCTNEDPRWNYEGIKIEEDLDYEIISPIYPFTDYAIDAPGLKVSEHMSMSIVLKFVNWERIFRPFVLETPMTSNKAAGNENIKHTVDLKSLGDQFRISGRYAYEISLNSELMSLNKMIGVLEDAEYVEPVKTKPIVSFRYMVLIVIICIVVIVGYILHRFRIVSIPQRKRKESYEPLIEEHEVSMQSPATA